MNIEISWDLNTFFILSQIFTVFAYVALGATYIVRTRNQILIFVCISIILQGFAYFFLSAWTAFWMVGIALFRTVAFFVHDKVNKKADKTKITIFDTIIFSLVVVGSIVVSIFAFEGFWSLFAIFGTVLYSFSIYQKSIKMYRILAVPVETLWIVYLVFVASPFGILLETLLLGVAIASIVFYGIIEKISQKQKSD